MKKIVISGYYGFNNLGDEAVLYSMIAALRKIDPDLRLIVLSNDTEDTKKRYDVDAVNRWQMTEICRALSDAHLLVSGGGSLLQDVTGIKSLLYYLGVAWLALRLKKPVVFYAQGIGPVRSRFGRFLVRKIANQVKLIIVRDEQSARDLVQMGVNKLPLYTTVDPVLGLSCNNIGIRAGYDLLRRAGLNPLQPEKPLAGMSLRKWPGFSGEKQKAVARVADELSIRGWKIVFLPFHYPDDVAICKKVAGMMNESAVILEKNFLIEEMISVIKCLDFLIGMRLHALILAAVSNVPFTGISYDPKIDRFLKQLKLSPAASVKNLNFLSLWSAVDTVIIDSEDFKKRLEQEVEKLQKLAHKSAALTLEVIS